MIDKACRGSEVPLRALWYKAKGGGGRLRQATERKEDRYIEITRIKLNVLIANPMNGRSGAGSWVIKRV